MKGIEKARMGMIAVAAVMLESVVRRLMGARRLSSGMMALVVAGMVLVVAAGGTSALPACPAPGNTVITASCELDQDWDVPAGQHGYIIGADNMVIDGNGYYISGSTAGDVCFTDEGKQPAGIYNYNEARMYGYSNVMIENLEVKNFCTGILVRGAIATKKVEDNTIFRCNIHDNGDPAEDMNTFGIHLFKHVYNSTIDECEIHHNTGGASSAMACDSGGMGIRLKVGCSHNDIIQNYIHDNVHSGIFTKGGCKFNYVGDNDITGNGLSATGAPCGGITMRCKKTDNWTVEMNNVIDNFGPGMYVGGSYNTIRYNTVMDCKDVAGGDLPSGYAIEVGRSDGGGINNELHTNTFCNNNAGVVDIYVCTSGSCTGNIGDDNTCDTTSNYDDDGTTGCTFSCSPPEKPDLTITAKSETLTGSTFKVTYTVKNTGGVAAGASTTGVYAGSTQIATDSVGALTAGASHTSTVTIDPFDCPCGTTVAIKVCADKDSAVDESDETNNCRENTFNCPPCAANPKLCTSPDPPSHDFGSVQQGQTRTWTFDVTNCGGGTLTWTASDDQSWITVSPTSGSATTEADTVTVTINTAGLSDGSHTGTITVGSNGGTKTGTISINVQSGQVDPKLCTDPVTPSHNFGNVQQGQTETWTFGITNCGGEALTWTASDDQTWITVSPTSGSATTETDTVTVTINTTGLSDGSHTGTITVGSNGGTKTGTISINVQSGQVDPKLCTDPVTPSHNFGNVQQGQTETWTFGITNCGGEALTWTASDDQTWITVSPTSGSATTETDTVTVTINTTGLSDGSHTGTITVGSNDGTKTGTIKVYVGRPMDVPALTPIGILSLFGLLGIVAIGSIRRR